MSKEKCRAFGMHIEEDELCKGCEKKLKNDCVAETRRKLSNGA